MAIMNVFTNPTAKTIMNQTLAAGAASLSMAGFFKVLRHVHGVSAEQSLQSLKNVVDSDEEASLLMQDTTLLDLLDRLRMQESFAIDEFKEVIKKSAELVSVKLEFDSLVNARKATFSNAKQVRTKCQDWLESVRLMQAVVEIQSPSLMDDFDEVAADCVKYHKTTNESALLDVQCQ